MTSNEQRVKNLALSLARELKSTKPISDDKEAIELACEEMEYRSQLGDWSYVDLVIECFEEIPL